MTFNNDLGVLLDLMQAHQPPTRPAARYVAAGRFSFLQRVFGALVAELIKVLDEIQGPDFQTLLAALPADGREAYGRLVAAPRDRKHPVFGALARVRDKAAF